MATSTKIEITAVDKTQKAFAGVKTSLSSVDKAASQVKGSLGGLQSAVGALAGVAGFGALVSTFRDVGDRLGKVSSQLNITTEALQALRFAAEQSGVSNSQLDTALQRLNRRLGDFVTTGGGPAAAAFERLGIATTDSSGAVRRADEVFVDIADAISGIESPAEKASLAFKFFDRAGADLLVMLNSGRSGLEDYRRQLESTGAVIEEEAIRNTEAFNDAMNLLERSIRGKVVNAMAGPLKTALETVNENFGLVTTAVGALTVALIAAAAPAAIGAVVAGVTNIISVMTVLQTVMLANPITAIATGLAALAAWFVSSNWDAISNGLSEIKEKISGLGKVTVQSLTKEINDLSTAQRDELLALDKLVTENGNLNVIQENQARIMRLNIAERGEKIKKLRAELDGINEVAAAQKEETKETGKATSASKLTADQLARSKEIREQLNKLTGGTLELSKDEIKNQTKIYEIGQKNSLVTGEVSEANQAYFESMKGHLTVAEEMQATELQKKIFLQAHADLMEEQKQKQQEQLDLENKIYAVGQKNSLITGETSEANQAYFESMKDHLTVVEEVTATELQKKLFLKAHAELMEEANRKKQRQLEIENEIYAVGQKNSLMTGQASQASQDFFKSVNDRLAVEKESEALAQQQLEIAKGIFLTNMQQGKYTEQQATELATQLGLVEQMEALQQVLNDKKQAEAEIESDLNFFLDERAKKQSTFNKLLDGAKKKFGEINSVAKSSAGALADNSLFQDVTGAAGASGGRAMSIVKATAEGGIQKGLMTLVLSNAKVQEALGKVFDAIFALIDPLIDLLVPALDALTPAIEELKPIFESLKPYFKALGAALKVQAVAIGQFFKGFAELVKVFETNTGFVRDFGKELEKVGPRIEQLGHKLEEFGQGLLDGVKTIGETLLTGIKEFIEGLGTELLNLPGKLATGIVDGLADLPEDLTTGIASGLTDLPGDITDGITDALTDLPGDITDGITDALTDLPGDITDGITDALTDLPGDITDGITDGLTDLPGDITDSITDGLTDLPGDIADSIAKIFGEDVVDFTEFIGDKLEDIISIDDDVNLVDLLTGAVSNIFDAVVPSGTIPLLPNPFHPFGLGPANLLEYKFAQGGYLRGPSHAQGGMPALVGGRRPVELEGGEFIIRKSAVQSLGLKALYALNSATNSKRGQQVRDAMGIKEFGAGGLAGGSWVKPFRKSELGLSLRDLGDVGNKIADIIGNHGVEFGLEFPDKSSAKIFGVGGLISEGTKSGNLGKEFINEGNDILGRIKASFDAGIFPPSLSMSASYDPPWSSLWPFASGGPVPVIQNGAARGGSYSSAPPVIEVSIYDGTGQRISEYDSALRVEIKERAARNSQFAAVA